MPDYTNSTSGRASNVPERDKRAIQTGDRRSGKSPETSGSQKAITVKVDSKIVTKDGKLVIIPRHKRRPKHD